MKEETCSSYDTKPLYGRIPGHWPLEPLQCRRGRLGTGLRGTELRGTGLRWIVAGLTAAALLLAAACVLTALVLGWKPSTQPDVPSAGKQLEPGPSQTPSAMLTVPNGITGNLDSILWESKRGNAFCRGGFNYSGGKLSVPVDGYYRVFLQITYAGGTCNETQLKLTTTVSLIHDSYPAERKLLSAQDVVGCSSPRWWKSLYTGGLFLLRAGSTLWVTASHHRLISSTEQSCFFGAMLWEADCSRTNPMCR